MALRYDLRINQGETFQLSVPVYEEDGSPAALSGRTARGQIRNHAASPTALYEWVAGAGNLAFDGSSVVITVPATDSSEWAWRTGVWSLELADDDGVVTQLIEGYVIIHPEVTRP